MEIVLALLIGAAFGAVLDRIGASNPNVIWNMLALRALGLMKVILLGIGVAAILIFAGQMVGFVDVANMAIKAAYVGVILGGLMLGFGWALSGYCPGTGVCAAAAGRWDAVAYVLGGLAGAGAYVLAYSTAKGLGLLEPILGGEVTLGAVPGGDFPALFPSLPGDVVGIAVGVVFVLIAFALPHRPRGAATPSQQPAE